MNELKDVEKGKFQNSDITSILAFWKAVELFTLSPVPLPTKADSENFFKSFEKNIVLPWEDDFSPKLKPLSQDKCVRKYQVYCGVYNTDKVIGILENKFGNDPESFDERKSGESCLCTFEITQDGRPLLESFVLSSCGWAIGKLINSATVSCDWLSYFKANSEDLTADFAEICSILSSDEEGKKLQKEDKKVGRKVTSQFLLKYTESLFKKLGAEQLSDKCIVRINSFFVAEFKQFDLSDQGFLNSFFVQDLELLIQEISTGNINLPLKKYISSEKDLSAFNKVDIRKDKTTLIDQLSPELFPQGRWPSKGHYPLVFSQQFAINSIVNELSASTGIFAVNGPPGTGKTTLLRDLIAAIVVKRAIELAKLKNPKDAFKAGEKVTYKSNGYNRVISLWTEQFASFGIVVASNNNGAVENISKEIPALSAIDESWLDFTDYYADFSSRVLKEPAWALMAACLGKSSNKKEFESQFWWKDNKSEVPDSEVAQGFNNYLQQKSKGDLTSTWIEAVQKFKDAISAEEEIRQQQVGYFKNLKKKLLLVKRTAEIVSEMKNTELQHACLTTDHTKHSEKILCCKEDYNNVVDHRLDNRKFRPSLIEITLSLGKSYSEWKTKDRNLAFKIDEQHRVLEKCRSDLLRLNIEIEKTVNCLNQLRMELNNAQNTIRTIDESFDKARENGIEIPDVNSWDVFEEKREKSSPWSSPEWNKKRSAVFLEALRLHKTFIEHNADKMRNNLTGAMEILNGKIPPGVDPRGLKAAWDSLFFVVPVISTTFASFDKLFSLLNCGDIGWLLIDEAGQAAPQAAAGAIWRSRRTVVVGDPLQLEPVISIPFTAQQALRRHYEVNETWIPGRTSVQQLADRACQYGTYLRTSDGGSIWVGSPLRVHRRCERPMFDISNQIAYDGLMVYGTLEKKRESLPQSTWIHVKSTGEINGHWVYSEGQELERLVNSLVHSGVSKEEIFLISPFRSVVKYLRDFVCDYKGIRAGTIHTVQGKESDVVILVLGTAPPSVRARTWAASKPNLLNVAVSRAKRRLYIIGDRDVWKQQANFDVAVKYLA